MFVRCADFLRLNGRTSVKAKDYPYYLCVLFKSSSLLGGGKGGLVFDTNVTVDLKNISQSIRLLMGSLSAFEW